MTYKTLQSVFDYVMKKTFTEAPTVSTIPLRRYHQSLGEILDQVDFDAIEQELIRNNSKAMVKSFKKQINKELDTLNGSIGDRERNLIYLDRIIQECIKNTNNNLQKT